MDKLFEARKFYKINKIDASGFLRRRKYQEVTHTFLLLDLASDKYHSLISYFWGHNAKPFQLLLNKEMGQQSWNVTFSYFIWKT